MKEIKLKNKKVDEIITQLNECSKNKVNVKMKFKDNNLYLIDGDLFEIFSNGRIETKIDGKIVCIDKGLESGTPEIHIDKIDGEKNGSM